MSVRMALVKLSAFAAGGAIIGGGAVHVAEAPAQQVQYVKHAKGSGVAVNKAKRPADGKQMLLNLSLLVRKENVSSLGQVLDAIQAEEGVEVRFTGPWPPYSFVAKKGAPGAA